MHIYMYTSNAGWLKTLLTFCMDTLRFTFLQSVNPTCLVANNHEFLQSSYPFTEKLAQQRALYIHTSLKFLSPKLCGGETQHECESSSHWTEPRDGFRTAIKALKILIILSIRFCDTAHRQNYIKPIVSLYFH